MIVLPSGRAGEPADRRARPRAPRGQKAKARPPLRVRDSQTSSPRRDAGRPTRVDAVDDLLSQAPRVDLRQAGECPANGAARVRGATVGHWRKQRVARALHVVGRDGRRRLVAERRQHAGAHARLRLRSVLLDVLHLGRPVLEVEAVDERAERDGAGRERHPRQSSDDPHVAVGDARLDGGHERLRRPFRRLLGCHGAPLTVGVAILHPPIRRRLSFPGCRRCPCCTSGVEARRPMPATAGVVVYALAAIDAAIVHRLENVDEFAKIAVLFGTAGAAEHVGVRVASARAAPWS